MSYAYWITIDFRTEFRGWERELDFMTWQRALERTEELFQLGASHVKLSR